MHDYFLPMSGACFMDMIAFGIERDAHDHLLHLKFINGFHTHFKQTGDNSRILAA